MNIVRYESRIIIWTYRLSLNNATKNSRPWIKLRHTLNMPKIHSFAVLSELRQKHKMNRGLI